LREWTTLPRALSGVILDWLAGSFGFNTDRFTIHARDMARCADYCAIIRNIDHIKKSIGPDSDIIPHRQWAQ